MDTRPVTTGDPNDITSPPMRGVRELKAIWLLIAGSYMAATLVGAIDFSLWNQVQVLWDSQATIRDILLHPHGLRYILTLPIFTISNLTGWPVDWVFSQSIAALVIGTGIILAKTLRCLHQGEDTKDRGGVLLATTTFFIILSLFMNGRIVPAIFGVALLLHTLVVWEVGERRWFRTLAIVLLCLFMASVSSGTFIVVLTTFYGWIAIKVFVTPRATVQDKATRIVLLTAFLGFVAVIPLLRVLVEKNVGFFGDGLEGVMEMMNHGLGALLISAETFVWGSIVVILAVATIGFLLMSFAFKPARLPAYAASVGVAGGIFGYSTLVAAVPPLVLLVILLAGRVKAIDGKA